MVSGSNSLSNKDGKWDLLHQSCVAAVLLSEMGRGVVVPRKRERKAWCGKGLPLYDKGHSKQPQPMTRAYLTVPVTPAALSLGELRNSDVLWFAPNLILPSAHIFHAPGHISYPRLNSVVSNSLTPPART